MNMMWLMDEWLAEGRFVCSLSVPAKYGDEYTLTEIWEPFCSSFKKLGKVFGDELLHISKLLEELRDLPKIRNMKAAHENDFAQEFPRSVIGDIATNAITLVKSLYCLDCHTFVKPVPNRHSPQLLTCRCEAVRYIKPSKAQQSKDEEATDAAS